MNLQEQFKPLIVNTLSRVCNVNNIGIEDLNNIEELIIDKPQIMFSIINALSNISNINYKEKKHIDNIKSFIIVQNQLKFLIIKNLYNIYNSDAYLYYVMTLNHEINWISLYYYLYLAVLNKEHFNFFPILNIPKRSAFLQVADIKDMLIESIKLFNLNGSMNFDLKKSIDWFILEYEHRNIFSAHACVQSDILDYFNLQKDILYYLNLQKDIKISECNYLYGFTFDEIKKKKITILNTLKRIKMYMEKSNLLVLKLGVNIWIENIDQLIKNYENNYILYL